MVQILGFSAPVRFKGHFEEIAITKVLLNNKPRRVGVSGMSVFRRLRKCGERKKTAVKYNGSLAIARAGDHNNNSNNHNCMAVHFCIKSPTRSVTV